MKAYEVKKGDVEIQRGRVMMAIEGAEDAVATLTKAMSFNGYASTQCAEYGDKDGEIIEYFMIARTDKADFMSTYKANK